MIVWNEAPACATFNARVKSSSRRSGAAARSGPSPTSCEVLAQPIYLCAAMSPHIVDVSFLRIALHETPATLRARLQAEIDAAGPEYDAVVLAYELCGGATVGLAAGRVPLIVPRAHDCITVFLGSRERYQGEFVEHPGTYWYAADYLERSDVEMEGASNGLFGVGASTEAELQAAYADLPDAHTRCLPQ